MAKTAASSPITAKEIVGVILRDYGPVEKVILFGSRARGNADESSDLDLIVVKNTDKPFVRRLVDAPYFSIHSDIFVYTPKEFEQMQENENPFVMNALEHGVVLYPAS
ncbi:MAG: nucleotidyltransferase domain-containing protein [Patescibacteria group bacterium]